MKRLAIFASGSGTNAEQIIKHFHGGAHGAEVVLILSNNVNAYVLERAKKYKIESHVFERSAFRDTNEIVDLLKGRKIDLLVLAGFLWLIPKNLITAFPDKILNIHPALLPKYGGKGMYGMRVHESVVSNHEKESGITIHLVDEIYDHGRILRQEKCEVLASDTPDQVAEKIHALEYQYFAQTIEEYLSEN